MDIKKFVKTNWLFLSALVFLVVIITVLLSLRGPSIAYKIEAAKVSSSITDTSSMVSPMSIFNQKENQTAGFILVDVRSRDEFFKGHIQKAVSIPVRELLDNNSVLFFRKAAKEHSQIILYGNDQLQANSPWMLLKQLGFDNIKVLEGGYSFFKNLPIADSLMQTGIAALNVEKSIVDTTLFSKSSQQPGNGTSSGKKAAEKVIPVKKSGSAGGGC
ncbi:MAG: rhodanese-like domain-containing protein [Bacteroidetes bacterium]|nr:rhodanese-like domain-containing protein [Bacteroidota bacterium]